jgi:hypothetical protein
MGREVAFSRRIRILFKTTTNLHDLQRTVLAYGDPDTRRKALEGARHS